MPDQLVYDLMLEVTGVLRSIPARTTLHSELRVGDTFDLRGRNWIVLKVSQVDREDLDRRVLAHEVEPAAA